MSDGPHTELPDPTGPRGPAKPGPGMLDMAVSAALSMAKFAASGFQRVHPEVHAARCEQCARCSHLDGSRCRLCGCFVDIKAWLSHEDCPVGNWTV